MRDRVRIVLVETSHPGNIGAAARAMKNMDLDELWLVAPKSFPDVEATARASGAQDILESARVVESLDEAIAGCAVVAGTSARLRRLAWPEITPRECATLIRELPGDVSTAIIFGREKTGLTNDEMDRCSHMLSIPANPEYSSLNLAAAVQIVGYELFDSKASRKSVEEPESPPATADELERYYAHLESVMVEIGFLNPDNPRHLMRRIRRLHNRAGLDQNEVNILRGILTAVQKKWS
ncbi:MAG: RNA methyltransferase [Gammaproteobacteria bacterium]